MSEPSLYQRLMGPAFERLPPALRELHGSTGGFEARGSCEVRRGSGMLSRLLGRIVGVPPSAERLPLHFTVEVADGGERWIRRFGGHVMGSGFVALDGRLQERLGPVVLVHDLECADGGLHTRLRSMRFLGVPVPRWLHPRLRAFAHEDAGIYRFDVAAELPVAGLIVAYRGTLQLDDRRPVDDGTDPIPNL